MHPTPTLIFDFDGTICLGPAPVRDYARRLSVRLPDAGQSRVWEALERFEAGEGDDPDGYAAIRAACVDEVDPHDAAAAYRESRMWLGRHPQAVSTPDGLVEFLAAADRVGTLRVLMTNCASEGAWQVLRAHGLDRSFDRVIGDAAKPDRWPVHLCALVGRGGASHVMSVGDVWLNDCAPVLRVGGAAAFIDSRRLRTGPATLTAPELPQLFDDLLEWAGDPTTFVAGHPLTLA